MNTRPDSSAQPTFTAFAGTTHLITANRADTVRRVWEHLQREPQAQVLIFADEDGRQVDFDLHGGLEEVLARVAPPSPKRGPGRPRLGVVSGEVSLLPRHWEWLAGQPARASGTLRQLVEAARKDPEGRQQARRRLEAAGRFVWALAGNLPGFEEASRALYARAWARLDEHTAAWPADVRAHLRRLLGPVREPAPSGAGQGASAGQADHGAGQGVGRAPITVTPAMRRAAQEPLDPGGELWRLPAAAVAARVARGELSAAEAVESALARIEAVNPAVNAVVRVFAEQSREAAAELDRRRDAGEPCGPLAGVPFTVKANIDVAGMPTTHGVPALQQAVAPRDAPLVRRLRAAGAIPVGHTNMPDLALRFHTCSQLYGATRNPWDRAASPGGSSGGEGVALATGMSALGLGNDAGGSVRVPALFGAVAALKPGFGRLASDRSVGPRDPALASQLIPVEGLLARSVGDLQLAYQVLAGPETCDPRAAPVPLFGPGPDRPLRVAVDADPGGRGVDAAVRGAVESAAAALEKAGYLPEEVRLPRVAEIVEAYGRMIMTEFHQSWPMLERLLGEEGRRYVRLAMGLREPADLAGYLNLTAARLGLQREWGELLERYPLILGPVCTLAGVSPDFDIRGPEEHRAVSEALRLCAASSFLGLPAAAVPTALAGGRPVGVQLIAGAWREDLCLEAAAALEAAIGRFTPIDPR